MGTATWGAQKCSCFPGVNEGVRHQRRCATPPLCLRTCYIPSPGLTSFRGGRGNSSYTVVQNMVAGRVLQYSAVRRASLSLLLVRSSALSNPFGKLARACSPILVGKAPTCHGPWNLRDRRPTSQALRESEEIATCRCSTNMTGSLGRQQSSAQSAHQVVRGQQRSRLGIRLT